MERMRIFGNMISKLSDEQHISNDSMCQKLDCTEERLYALLSGCTMPTYEELELLSDVLGQTPEDLLAGDLNHYKSTVVHCMNEFRNPKAREEILDIIEGYVKLVSAVTT